MKLFFSSASRIPEVKEKVVMNVVDELAVIVDDVHELCFSAL